MPEFDRDALMMQIAMDIVAEIQHQIVSDNLVFKRQLFESWEITKEADGSITIGSSLPYAAVMDDGRAPGKMPPVNAIFPWVQDKIKTKSKEEAMSIAWAVAKSIEQNGIEPRHYVRSALFNIEKESEV